MDATDNLKRISERSQEAFRSKARIQSFADYLGDMTADPLLYVRCAPEYLADVVGLLTQNLHKEESEGRGGSVSS